jgi:hypothetical protein
MIAVWALVDPQRARRSTPGERPWVRTRVTTHDLDAWLGQEITCPDPARHGPLRLDRFTVGGDSREP